MVEEGDTLWANLKSGFPSAMLGNISSRFAMAGDYAQEFGSEAARRTFLKAARRYGRRRAVGCGYLFPLRINADFSILPGVPLRIRLRRELTYT